MWQLHKFAAGILCALAFAASSRAQWHVGDELPRFREWTLTGKPLPVTRGQVVLVDFWASWCAPCKASFPAYSRMQEDYRALGFVIVAVSVDEDAAACAAFLRRLKPAFPTLHDGQQRLVRVAQVPAMPTSYLFGRDGRLRFVHPGFRGQATETELRRQIELLLKEKN